MPTGENSPLCVVTFLFFLTAARFRGRGRGRGCGQDVTGQTVKLGVHGTACRHPLADAAVFRVSVPILHYKCEPGNEMEVVLATPVQTYGRVMLPGQDVHVTLDALEPAWPQVTDASDTVRIVSRSTSPQWWPIRFRLALRAYDAPRWGARVASPTESRYIHTHPQNITALGREQGYFYRLRNRTRALPLMAASADNQALAAHAGIVPPNSLRDAEPAEEYEFHPPPSLDVEFITAVQGQPARNATAYTPRIEGCDAMVATDADMADTRTLTDSIPEWVIKKGTMVHPTVVVTEELVYPDGGNASCSWVEYQNTKRDAVAVSHHSRLGFSSEDLIMLQYDPNGAEYASRAVQLHPHGGQSDFVWLSARTPHGAYVW